MFLIVLNSSLPLLQPKTGMVDPDSSDPVPKALGVSLNYSIKNPLGATKFILEFIVWGF